ncbi:hypothetical protein CH063_10656, partial [Colletotrichum higginsianum]
VRCKVLFRPSRVSTSMRRRKQLAAPHIPDGLRLPNPRKDGHQMDHRASTQRRWIFRRDCLS